jgi:hypothetical protein
LKEYRDEHAQVWESEASFIDWLGSPDLVFGTKTCKIFFFWAVRLYKYEQQAV